MVANRNGFFYVFDRATGQLLVGKPFSDTTWARELDANGHPDRPQRWQQGLPARSVGQHQLHAAVLRSGSPAVLRHRARDLRRHTVPVKEEIVPGRISNSGTVRRDADRSYGVLRAIDPVTVERKWEFKYPTPTMAGVMSTASGVVFAGDNEGNFMAFDARTGKNLWFFPDRRADLGRGADDLHARWAAARRHRVGHDRYRFCAAPGVSMWRSTVLLATSLWLGLAVATMPAQAPQGGGRGGRGPAAGQTVEKIRTLKPNLYMITGGGANTLVRVTPDGLIVVDTKNPGDENFNRADGRDRVGVDAAGQVRHQHAAPSRSRRQQPEVHRRRRHGRRARRAEDASWPATRARRTFPGCRRRRLRRTTC